MWRKMLAPHSTKAMKIFRHEGFWLSSREFPLNFVWSFDACGG
jgi:hypothetical protein